ncbi:hypothetical protein F5887DRAFT_988025, partial [Amanita rubescens]
MADSSVPLPTAFFKLRPLKNLVVANSDTPQIFAACVEAPVAHFALCVTGLRLRRPRVRSCL